VRIVGGGNAAGYMANNNLMGVLSAAVGAQPRAKKAGANQELTEAEKQERQAFIERWQRLGLLPPDDQSSGSEATTSTTSTSTSESADSQQADVHESKDDETNTGN
jgi:hypothetical protein